MLPTFNKCQVRIIGASLSEPHTSELNGRFFTYILLYIIACRTSFRKCMLTEDSIRSVRTCLYQTFMNSMF